MKELTHVEGNRPAMVDVSRKGDMYSVAKARGFIHLTLETLSLISENKIKKGNVLTVAEIAGIQAAKKTSDLIPLCHNIFISRIGVRAEVKEGGIEVNAEAVCIGPTGIEMEVLTAVSVALLTVYDMCKAVDKTMKISDIVLVEKSKKDLQDI